MFPHNFFRVPFQGVSVKSFHIFSPSTKALERQRAKNRWPFRDTTYLANIPLSIHSIVWDLRDLIQLKSATNFSHAVHLS